MYPAYRWTDSYPYHTNPSAKEMDRGMNSPYYPWPYPSSHCYPTPQSCHSCCNHTYFGGPAPYSFIPPYPHYPPPPPPPFHTHGFYPPPPGAHPAYSFPPPHYSTEQPRYDYDKNTPTPTPTHHHCCGSEKKSTIQPQEPEVDKKTSESLVPFLKDCPYPIMWVPSNYTNTESNAKEKEKENHSHDPVVKPPEPSKQGENEKIPQESFPFPIFWLPSKNNEVKNDMKEDEKTRKNEAEYEKSGKHGVQKVIPVKQLETKEEKEQKTSKLPPVCLRIDPLPKKKNSSRSPSPPSGDKKRLKGSGTEDSKSCKQQTESSEGVKNDNKKVEKDSEKGVEVEGSKVEKMKKLSENEAVLMIQSVYRGFEVRKSQPLMKLREIAKVGKQVGELRKRIQDLESSCVDDKQKLVIGETIMSLLLKLDTIQGLHPVVRDVRKSVAKELVGLQEMLDSLTIIKQSTTTSADEDQTLAQPDVEATESQDADGGEVRDTGVEPKVELQNEKNTGELIDQMEMEQPVVDREKAQSDTNSEAARLDLDDHEQVCSEELNNEEEKFDQAQPQSELQNEVNNVELNNDQMELEQPVDHEKAQSDGNNDALVSLDLDDHEPTSVELNNDQEKSDQAQPAELLNEENTGGIKSDQMQTLMELEVADPTHDMKPEHLAEQSSGELNNDQVQMAVDTEQPVVDVVKEAQSESGIRVETMDSDEGGVEPRDINLEPEEGKQSIVDFTGDQLEEIKPPAEEEREALVFENADSMENLTTATVEARDLGKHDLDREEAPMVDDVDGSTKELLMEDIEEVPPRTAAGNNVSIGGRKLMEENEKLRAAVEELMKAGKDQVSVIKELTGRVKDLEKKLSTKRKRKVKRSSRRPRGSLVEEDLKSCA